MARSRRSTSTHAASAASTQAKVRADHGRSGRIRVVGGVEAHAPCHLRAELLSDGPAGGRYSATDLQDLTKLSGLPRIPRADVASFLLTAATTDEWIDRVAVVHPVV